MIEGCNDEAPMRSTSFDDLGPAPTTAVGQGRPFVRPVGGMNGGSLDDDRPTPASGAALVVGDVAIRECAIVVAEVRDVGPEHQPVRSCSSTEGKMGQ